MELLTDEIKAKLPKFGTTSMRDGKAIVKLFTPDANWTWYITEGELQPDGDWMLFGLVEGMETEWGYSSFNEIAAIRGPLDLPVERAVNFDGIIPVRFQRR